MAFDAQAATNTYIDSLGSEALAQAAAYTAGNQWLMLWSLGVTIISTCSLYGAASSPHCPTSFLGRALQSRIQSERGLYRFICHYRVTVDHLHQLVSADPIRHDRSTAG